MFSIVLLSPFAIYLPKVNTMLRQFFFEKATMF